MNKNIEYNNIEYDDINGVSVLIPFYNGIEFLEEAIASVLSQTYKKLEILIGVNGHDKTSTVFNEINKIVNNLIINTKTHMNIRIIYYDIKSAPLTLNKLAKDAIYDYVAFLDADDIWTSNKIECQMPYINNGYDIVGALCLYFGNMSFTPQIPLNDISDTDIFNNNPLLHSTILIKKELVNFEEHFIYDYNLWFKLFAEHKKVFNVPEILLYHRIHNNSAFNTSNANYLKDLKNKWKEYYFTHHGFITNLENK